VGVTCAEFGRAGPNPHLDEIVEAKILTERLEHLVRRADAYVVLPGGNGTLAELSLAWEHLRKGLVEPRPLVVWEDPWRPIVDAIAAGPYLNSGTEHITWVDDVDAAVASITARVPRKR
jgi:predicted Rossmann-fold nucleotide-binding protein